jgi:predicted alpha/beta hydrolase family esterase
MCEHEILIIPGWGNSGPGHWQTIWASELPHARRVEQREWVRVTVDDWVQTLDRHIQDCRKPVTLVAHSLACILVAHWAARHPRAEGVEAALLVAPTDVEDATTAPTETTCFAPIPRGALPFKSVVVASSDDPYIKEHRAAELAKSWGSKFVNLGSAGHMNVASGYGPWPQGREILAQLVREC